MSDEHETLKLAISAVSAVVAVVGAAVSQINLRETRRETFKARLVEARLLIVGNRALLNDLNRRLERLAADLSALSPTADIQGVPRIEAMKGQAATVKSWVAEAMRVFSHAVIEADFVYSKSHSEKLYRIATNEGALGKLLATASTEVSNAEQECVGLRK